MLASISTDHSPVSFPRSKEKGTIIGKRFWKFNSSLAKYQNYIIEIKKLTRNFCTKNLFLFNRQLIWETLKWEVTKFTIQYIKHVAKEKRQQRTNLGNLL